MSRSKIRGAALTPTWLALRIAVLSLAAPLVPVACSESRPPVSDTGEVKKPTTPPAENTTCAHDGDTRDCHVDMGARNGVRSCFHGRQVCTDGSWGPCAGETGTVTGQSLAGGYLTGSEQTALPSPLSVLDPRGVRMTTTKSLNGSSPDSGACKSNPCDPTCNGFDEDAGIGITPDAGVVGNTYYSADPLSGVPGGFVNKGITSPCTVSSDCNFDTYCDKSAPRPAACGANTNCGQCVFYKNGEKNASCSGIDLTAGRACLAQDTYPLCNRGTVDLLQAVYPTIEVYKKNGGGNQFGNSCIPDQGTAACQVTVPAGGIKAGTCIDAPLCGNSGNVTLFVNATYNAGGSRRVPECSLGGETGCVNNWTDIKAAGDAAGSCTAMGTISYLPKTYVQTYQASCPVGSVPQWMFLAYDATTPSSNGSSSSIKFAVRAGTPADGGTVAYGSSTTVALTPPSPAACPMSGVATCPKDLYTSLGGIPGAQKSMLELTVTLTPSPDAQVAPTLKSWQVTYSCPPSQ